LKNQVEKFLKIEGKRKKNASRLLQRRRKIEKVKRVCQIDVKLANKVCSSEKRTKILRKDVRDVKMI
jgi:hypothetical protein